MRTHPGYLGALSAGSTRTYGVGAERGETYWLRGGLVGLAVAALAVAAHGAAGGDTPGSNGLALLLLIAGAVGALASVGPVRSRWAVAGWLVGGQLGCHTALSLFSGHGHGSGAGVSGSGAAAVLPDRLMVVAHAVAAILCAVLILAAERLYGLVSQAIRVAVTRPAPVPSRRGALRWVRAAGHIRHLLELGAVGPRAPPVAG
ncbi:hypothetical protein [Nocardia sp. NPDC050406]|uniref:hypothetical protein n=1 Tax=Nocardia sp. NPDC050406 TaxID=3364318 RepID=UPI0037A096B1